jgi:hypothetical protein
LFVWELVEDTGWTLEYIDSLPFGKIHERLQVIDGRNKANAEMNKKRGR